ncbi:MAG: polysaccharide deacetylase family protein [Opitutaceae bacterium]|nr:polysaccharide deacetylase family protein [Opitutaceae bacterium]
MPHINSTAFNCLLLRLLLPLLGVLPVGAGAAQPLRVAFVFDDGPAPDQAEKLLAVLAQAQVKVSFSYVGGAVDARPDLARKAFEAGHEINNHSYTHPHLRELSKEAAAKELSDTALAVEKAVGVKPKWFWPPFLETNEQIDGLAASVGSHPYPMSRLHLVSTDDWNLETTAQQIHDRALTDVKDRTVILCHEWRAETVQQLPSILVELKNRGATFLTFSELAATLD